MHSEVGKLLTTFKWDQSEIALVLKLHNFEEIRQLVSGQLNQVANFPGCGAVWQPLLPQLHGTKRRVTPQRDDIFFQL